jgi:acetyl-CoA/propionyl-CoA carboxylase biotin carboxyl carrier protein
MLAKVIAHGPDRETAIRRLDGALSGTTLLGVSTNIAFLRALLRHPSVLAGDLDTGLVERALDDLVAPEQAVPDPVYAVAALQRVLELEPGPAADPWDSPGGWRLGEPAWSTWRFELSGHDPVDVRVRGRAGAAEVSVNGGEPVACALRADGADYVLSYADATQRYTAAGGSAGTADGSTGGSAGSSGSSGSSGGEAGRRWLGRRGRTWALTETDRLAAARTSGAGGAAGGTLRSPMPGTVLSVAVVEGDRVDAGQPLVVIEAMKMEHSVRAPFDGMVGSVVVKPGATVGVDEPLVTVEAGTEQT